MLSFSHDEDGYLEWLSSNDRGFVVNTFQRPKAHYFVLHRSICRTILPGKGYVEGAFTERTYQKLAANRPEHFGVFMRQHGIASFSKRCSKCGA